MATCKDVVKRLRNLYNFYFSHNSFRKVGGSDNIIKYGKNCRFRDCHVYVRGNHNSVIFSENCNMMGLNILIEGDNNSIIFGKGVIVNASKVQPTVMNALGGCKIMIGDGSLFSNNIEIHTTDYHGIYDEHGKRIIPDKDIYIGNRVWCGLGCKILKGTNILDGTIIGAGSIVTGKIKEKNVIIAGNPAKIIKRQVFWNEKRLDSCMHMPKDLM